ncbi:serine/threonine protein kinase [Tautonia plasticadhaerens]|uniref:Serine/threonine-protein kinase PknD n=1 Tax=Tautonia plasticadhaerens TaxID=2527974 RepID=A0A518H8J1_9BACT|nr:serine/threonine-protein kinase [Tautonia plasticadhaerens]QDV37163.1 Serine/threonine-protein kinase PknD [Tautonia plasticadhaerens]
MSVPKNEESLRIGSMAVELGHADRVAVVRALDALGRDPSRSISTLLDEEGVFDPRARARIENAVGLELARLNNDPGKGPARLGTDQSDHDPLETMTDAIAFPSSFQISPGSDVNSITSALGLDVGGVDFVTGDIRTPVLGPPSSMDIPSGTPSSDSNLPRFDPNATAEANFDLASGFDPEATSHAEGLAVTEAAQNAAASPDFDRHDPMPTAGGDPAVTFQGPGPLPVSGTFGHGGGSGSRFRVVREHAKGGLGSVLVAFDEELRREVALKEIQERHADDPDSRSRFLVEAEITGGLEHPGVVPVYSLGRNPDGRPFYAMRFIRGESLRKAIERFHDPERGPKDPGAHILQLRGLLRRFVDVCNALEYAHSRGVIHRDIKPDNIMLGPYGETLLVDWGLAKALDHLDRSSRTEELPLRPISGAGSTPTLDGSAVGTPAFMSPEQAEGNLAVLGPPSDIYSLGATLYQILTGHPPFTERNLFQVLLQVRNGEFPPPRLVNPDIPPGLEAICLTAMARPIGDRYDSCQSLADDLEHWLADEPISVYVEPWSVRLGRWAKRHRTLVAGTAVLLITAVVALTVGAILLKREQSRTELQRQSALAGWREAEQNEAEAKAQKSVADQNAERARRNEALAHENARIAQENERLAHENAERAETQRALAEIQRQMAERNFQQAIDAVDALLTEVGEIDLADVPQMEQTRRDLLSKARTFYERFLHQNDSPETRRDAGRAQSRLGDIHELLGEYDEARASYFAALQTQVTLAEDLPEDDGLAADLARTRHSLAILLKKMSEFDQSEALLEQARSVRTRLVEEDPGDLEAQSNLASSTYQLGAVLSRLVGRRAGARQLYEDAIQMQREVVGGRGSQDEDRRELARYLNNLALLLQGAEGSGADVAFEESIRLQRGLVEEHSDVPHFARELARTLNNRVRDAVAYNPDVAEGPLRESIMLVERLTQDFPNVPEYWSELGGYLNNLGRAFVERGVIEDDQEAAMRADDLFRRAEDAFRRSEAIRAKLVENNPLRTEYRHRLALIRHNLARFLRGRGDANRARTKLEEAIFDLRQLIESNPQVPEYEKDLALALSEQAYSILDEDGGLARGLEIASEGLEFAELSSNDRGNDAIFLDAVRTLHLQVAWILHDLNRYGAMDEHANFLGNSAAGDSTWLFYAAELYVRSGELAQTDNTLPDAERTAVVDRTLAEAGLWLDRAAHAGFRSTERAEAVFGPYTQNDAIASALRMIESNSSKSQ